MTGDGAFAARCDRRDGAVIVVACGELDIASADDLRAVLGSPEAQAPTVILDLRQLQFIDSSGLSIVVEEHNRAKAEGFRFVVATGGAPTVERLLDLSGLRDTLAIVRTPMSC